ncbi:hypothetical protein AOLI_G00054370 [Acnodon oligacanthus]
MSSTSSADHSREIPHHQHRNCPLLLKLNTSIAEHESAPAFCNEARKSKGMRTQSEGERKIPTLAHVQENRRAGLFPQKAVLCAGMVEGRACEASFSSRFKLSPEVLSRLKQQQNLLRYVSSGPRDNRPHWHSFPCELASAQSCMANSGNGGQIKTSEDRTSSPRHLFTSPDTLQRHDRVMLIAKWHKHHEYECGPTGEKPRSVIATITGMC